MTELLTAAQMRAIERAAIEAGEVTGVELMERAGRGVVEAMLDWRPELATAPQHAVVLCGPGNNGGDGFVVARLLKQRGWDVELFLYGRDPAEIDKLSADAAVTAQRWREIGEICAWRRDAVRKACHSGPEQGIVVDALFGTGLTRPVPAIREIMEAGEGVPRPVPRPLSIVAVDIPSGLCADSGRPIAGDGVGEPWSAMQAELTVTFHRPKVGHYLAEGSARCGRIRCVDIGLREIRETPGRQEFVILPDLGGYRLLGKKDGQKYDHGHALVLAGGVGKGGAARMAARGALRIGAGLVTVGCPPAALQENAAALDAIMLRAFGGAGELTSFLPERKVSAVCIGPGFGHGERLRAFMAAVLGRVGRGGRSAHPTGVVIDADAISEFADNPRALFEMLHEGCVLTPHEGEFGRLFPDILAKLKAPAATGPAYSKVDATREAAARAGCVVLFKGPDTVIADPQGRCAISPAAYERAAPWLASAGSGDVLAGFVTGLLARGFGPFEAAETAAWLHVECALHFGPGLIAEDLPEQIPAVFRELGL